MPVQRLRHAKPARDIGELICLLDALNWMDQVRLAAMREARCGKFAEKRLDLIGNAISAEKAAVLARITVFEDTGRSGQFTRLDRLHALIRDALDGDDYEEVIALTDKLAVEAGYRPLVPSHQDSMRERA